MSTKEPNEQNSPASGYIELGAIVHDRDDPDPNPAVVVNRPPVTIDEWDVSGRGTVAEDNPDYDADEPVIIVAFASELSEEWPLYSGVRPLPVGEVFGRGVHPYAFPEARLEKVGEYGPHEVAVDDIDPFPFHSRNFEESENREFIAEIEERGYPDPIPLVRPVEDGFQVLNGHKRVWASHVAGLEMIYVRALYVDERQAIRTFLNRHYEDYGPEAQQQVIAEIIDAVADPESIFEDFDIRRGVSG